jgi:hypothetical protein
MGFDNIDNMALTAWVAGAVTLVFGILALPGIDKRMHRTPIAHWEPLGTPKDPTGGRPALPQGACPSRGSRQARPPDRLDLRTGLDLRTRLVLRTIIFRESASAREGRGRWWFVGWGRRPRWLWREPSEIGATGAVGTAAP